MYALASIGCVLSFFGVVVGIQARWPWYVIVVLAVLAVVLFLCDDLED